MALQELGARVAGESLRGRIGIQDAAVGVDPEERFRRAVERELREHEPLTLLVPAALADEQHPEPEGAERKEQRHRHGGDADDLQREGAVGQRNRPDERDDVERHAEREQRHGLQLALAAAPMSSDERGEGADGHDRPDAGRDSDAAERGPVDTRERRRRHRCAGTAEGSREQQRDIARIGQHAGGDDEGRVHAGDGDQTEHDAGKDRAERRPRLRPRASDDAVEQREREEEREISREIDEEIDERHYRAASLAHLRGMKSLK